MSDEQKQEPVRSDSGLDWTRQPPRPRVRRLWLPVGGTLVLALVAVTLLWRQAANKEGDEPPTQRTEVARLRSKLARLEREQDHLKRQLETLDGGPARAPEARDPERHR